MVFLARDLIGKVLHTQLDGAHVAALITETEAYNGVVDKACHAYGGRRTKRTETMYSNGGTSYIYLCYGIHFLFNVVVSGKDDPKAVLIRGVELITGDDAVRKRRKRWNDLIGPGKVTQGLGISTKHDLKDLTGDEIWVTQHALDLSKVSINVGPRIGVDYAEEDALLPYRFWIDKQDACILIDRIAL